MPDSIGPQPAPEDSPTASGCAHGGALDLESLWQLVEGEKRESSEDPLVGRMVAGITLRRLIAEGGMGRVYEGDQDSPRRAVAVKILRPGLLTRSSIRRFVQETQILASLQHPSITQIYSAGTFELAGTQLPYFVMELIPGALPVTEYSRVNNLTIPQRLDLFSQVCDAVAHAHARGFTHRDLKPSNVLVDTNGHPKVIDFGIARENAATIDPCTMTLTGQVLGTLQYMSPEQVNGGTVDARSDVYSLGMILYELVTGSTPYSVMSKPIAEAVGIIREWKPKAIAAIGCDCPSHIAPLVDECLQKEPMRRPGDAAILAVGIRCTGRGVRHGQAVAPLARLFSQLRWRHLGPPWVATTVLLLAILSAVVMIAWPDVLRMAAWAKITTITPPALKNASLLFRHSFSSVRDEEADRFLVEASGMQKWNYPQKDPELTYWGPTENGVEGRLVYRFGFPGRTARVRLDAESPCWDFEKHPGGFGCGVSAIEASRDGVTWVSIRDNIAHRNWGATWVVHESLPRELLGTSELWLRLRFLTSNVREDSGYTVAQFARSPIGNDVAVFAIEANCAPTGDSP